MAEKYYGESKEGIMITVITAVIVLSMVGACSLMNKTKEGCRSSEYTYCGEEAPAHAPH